MKAGRFTLQASGSGGRPDLSGLSCRRNDIPATRGVIVSLLVTPVTHGDAAFRRAVEQLLRELETSGEVARTVRAGAAKASSPGGCGFSSRPSCRTWSS